MPPPPLCTQLCSHTAVQPHSHAATAPPLLAAPQADQNPLRLCEGAMASLQQRAASCAEAAGQAAERLATAEAGIAGVTDTLAAKKKERGGLEDQLRRARWAGGWGRGEWGRGAWQPGGEERKGEGVKACWGLL